MNWDLPLQTYEGEGAVLLRRIPNTIFGNEVDIYDKYQFKLRTLYFNDKGICESGPIYLENMIYRNGYYFPWKEKDYIRQLKEKGFNVQFVEDNYNDMLSPEGFTFFSPDKFLVIHWNKKYGYIVSVARNEDDYLCLATYYVTDISKIPNCIDGYLSWRGKEKQTYPQIMQCN